MKTRNIETEHQIYLSLSESKPLCNDQYQYLFSECLKVAKSKIGRYSNGNSYSEDLVQEAMFHLIKKVREGTFKFCFQKGLIPYLCLTIRNLLQQENRKNLLSGNQDEFTKLIVTTEVKKICRKSLKVVLRQLLPSTGYKLIILSYFYKMSNEEIMKFMKYRNVNTVSSRKHHYLNVLRSQLQPHMLAA